MKTDMEGGSAFKPRVAPGVFISGCIQSQQTSAIRATSESRNTGQRKEKRKKKNDLKSLASACEAYCLWVYSNNWRLDSHCTLFIEFFVSKSNCKSAGEQIGFWKAMEMEIMLVHNSVNQQSVYKTEHAELGSKRNSHKSMQAADSGNRLKETSVKMLAYIKSQWVLTNEKKIHLKKGLKEMHRGWLHELTDLTIVWWSLLQSLQAWEYNTSHYKIHWHTHKGANIYCTVLYSNLWQQQDYLHMDSIQMCEKNTNT